MEYGAHHQKAQLYASGPFQFLRKEFLVTGNLTMVLYVAFTHPEYQD